MRFVDTNVFIYAAGRDTELRERALAMLTDAADAEVPLFTSAEVIQELLHVYLRRGELGVFDRLLAGFPRLLRQVVPVTQADVRDARALAQRHAELSARDLVHLAVCRRHGATDLLTFDCGLAAAWRGPSGT